MDLLTASTKVDETLGVAVLAAPNLPTPPSRTDTAQMVAEMTQMMASLR